MSEELDPYVAPNLETAELSWLSADGLVGSDLAAPEAGSLSAVPPKPGTFGPGRFTSFDYELRPGVRWHDGKPLVAADVAACVARVRTSTWAHQRPFSLIERIDVHDALHFTVRLTRPDPNFPRAFFSPLGSPGIPLVRPGHLPVGTGPFRVTSRALDVASYERWSGSPRGTPAVAAARLQFLGDDDTQEVKLSAGDTDVALFIAQNYALERGIPYVRRDRGVSYIVMNVRGALDTAQQREAFASAIDRKEVVEKFFRGWTTPYDSVVAPGVPGSQISLAPAYDPELARRIFSKWPKRPVEIVFYPGLAERTALFIQAQLARVGVDVVLHRYAVQEFLAPEGPLRLGKFDVALFGDSFSLDPDLTATWGCDTIPPNGGNFSRLCDPRFDALANAGDTRAALALLRDQYAVLPLVRSVQCIGLSKRLGRVQQPPDLLSAVYECATWSIA